MYSEYDNTKKGYLELLNESLKLNLIANHRRYVTRKGILCIY